MDSKARTRDERVYEDVEPPMEWAREPGTDTLIVYLPGFTKEQLKVQVTTARKLRLIGERPIDGNRWSRFRKEFPVPSNYDTNGISAKFEKGILYVKHPKQSTPPQENTQQPVEPPRTPEKVQPPQEAAVPQKPPQEAAVPQKLPQEAAVPQKPPQEKGQPSREPSNSRPEEKPSTENLNGTTGQRTEHDQPPPPDSVHPAAEKDKDSGEGAGKIENGSDEFKRESFRRDHRGLPMKLKEPSKLINFVLGILLVVVTVLYAMTALRSPSKSEN